MGAMGDETNARVVGTHKAAATDRERKIMVYGQVVGLIWKEVGLLGMWEGPRFVKKTFIWFIWWLLSSAIKKIANNIIHVDELTSWNRQYVHKYDTANTQGEKIQIFRQACYISF